MKLKDFNYISDYLNTSPKTLEALRDVLVYGVSMRQAAIDRGLDYSWLSRKVKSFPKSVCSECKQPIRRF